MINQFQLDYTFSFGAKNPKQVTERKDEDLKSHADTIAIVFSHSILEVTPLGNSMDALSIDGGVFFLLSGDRVGYIELEHFHHIP